MAVGAKNRRSICGSAMVEFVIVLPLMLLILFAIIETSVLLMRWQTISNAAREGARTAVLYRSPCNSGAVQTAVETVVVNYGAAGGIVIAGSDVNVTGSCAGAGSNSVVDVSFPFSFQVIHGMAPSLTPTISLTASSTMRNEG